MTTAPLRYLLPTAVLLTLIAAPALSQDENLSETVRIWPLESGTALVYKDGAACPGNVAVNDTAVTFNGTLETTSENPVPYEVEFTFGSSDGTGQLEGIEPTTNIGSWSTTSEEGTTRLLLSVGVSSAQALAWSFGLIGIQPGLVFYTWQTRLRGGIQRDESCTFEIILLPGRLVGQVALVDENGTFGLDGIEVTLFDANGDSVASTVTRPFEFDGVEGIDPMTERGWYFFNGLPPGKYTVRLRLREAYEPKDPDDDDPEVDIPSGEEVNRFIELVALNGIDWGDLPRPYPDDATRCPGPGGPFRCYQTLVIDDGARHVISEDVRLGFFLTAETDGQPDDAAAADGGDDGVFVSFFPTEGGEAELGIEVENFSDRDAHLSLWIDFNDNGILGDTAQELVVSEIVPAQIGVDFLIRKFNVPPLPRLGAYARARITTDPTASIFPRPFGLFLDGEVEDYLEFEVPQADFGDAPDEEDPTRPDIPAGYPTRFQDDGARHAISPSDFFSPDVEGVTLGRSIDPEEDGQPTLRADGDDRDAAQANDEDGIVFANGFTPFESTGRPGARDTPQFVYSVAPGDSATIIPLATVDGLLDAWFDWNRDGDWQEDERVFRNAPINETPNETPLRLGVPPDADEGYTFARFRYRIQGDVELTGLAANGEVEDYMLMVMQAVEVANADDDGPGSLRQALIAANETEGIQIIRLGGSTAAASKGLTPIFLQSPLPEITDPVIIDGGGSAILDGSSAGGGASGLTISAGGTVVTGLTIQNFADNGILIQNEETADDEAPVAVHNSLINGNGGAGVRISGGSARPGPTISGTRFVGNGGLGIDHSEEGVTTNDVESGFPAYPVITAVTSGSTRIEGAFSGEPETGYALEFFAGTACDRSGNGEAEFVIGSSAVVTDVEGQAAFSIEFDTTIANRHVVTATATDPTGTTSELSQCTASVDVERIDLVDLPTEFLLKQNYPNPFNRSTTIQFGVPEHVRVRLLVFDALGRIIDRDIDRVFAPGTYVVTLDVSAWSSGVYHYRLEAGPFAETRSMILLK